MSVDKIVRPGMLETPGGAHVSIFCRIEISDDGRLSISGVIGPRPSGNAWGGCGQIDMEFAHRNRADDDRRYDRPITPDEIRFADGWNAELWLDFLDVWKRWHLNDMRAECEHQRALGWNVLAREPRTLYHWQVTSETREAQRLVKRKVDETLASAGTVTLDDDERRLAGLPHWTTTATPEPPGPEYEPKREGAQEVKSRGWLRPAEHPDGLLTKPCPECGYAYGSAWQAEDLPTDVAGFLRGLPDADRTPAWV